MRDGLGVRVSVSDYRVDGERFETDAGEQLSDHRPVEAQLRVMVSP